MASTKGNREFKLNSRAKAILAFRIRTIITLLPNMKFGPVGSIFVQMLEIKRFEDFPRSCSRMPKVDLNSNR